MSTNSSSGSSNPNSSSSGGNERYTITSTGKNDQGNHYCHRDHGLDASNQNSYHYSNTDGSYYYSNADGSTYHNDGNGRATYKAPGKKD